MTDHLRCRAAPWYQTFHDLMPYRVREILLVSSPYDAFTLEEDGRLTEHIFTEYSELNLSSAPRITHVSTGARALELLSERRFDLVITMQRIVDTEVSTFARQIKQRHPGTPVVLLVFSEADLSEIPGGVDPQAVDRVFVWTGDVRILLAIIKLVEDQRNVKHDTHTAGVRVIIVVEDSAGRYSSFLGLLYQELMAQSESLVAEGVNELHRLMRMRTRPKILLATNFEEAMACYHQFVEYVVAVISDVRFPCDGVEDETAGFKLVRAIRVHDAELPILLDSVEPQNAQHAAALGINYLDKASANFLRNLRTFVAENLGFGDFVFRLPDRTEVARARDMYELEHVLRTVPAASLEYHATRNHFSLWLMARSMFALARLLRPQKVEALGGIEGVRTFLLDALRTVRVEEQEGVITDFSTRHTNADSHFVRLGRGSIGGKARGIAFVSSLLARQNLNDRFPELRVATPRSWAIATDVFDNFFEKNQILRGDNPSEQEILQRCRTGYLPDSLMQDLNRALDNMIGPLAVRSSSLLEDSQLQPFAGIYATYMLPNNHPDRVVRLDQLCQAIKAVYASTYSDDARSYVASTPYSIEEEKMAVLIQQMVGRTYGNRFYPAISGIGLSYNYYPVEPQHAQDGLAMLALGFGHMVVQGGAALQFSPCTPGVLPQFANAQEFLRYSQSRFYALDLDRLDPWQEATAALRLFELEDAETDGTLALVGSVYSRDDDRMIDNLSVPGPRVITFNNILKWGALPLAPLLTELLQLFRTSMGCPVEIEFAIDPGNFGQSAVHERERQIPCLNVLQIRPQGAQLPDGTIEPEAAPPQRIFCHTDRSLGHGIIDNIRDIVWVPRRDLSALETPLVAGEVGLINARLQAAHAPYLLVGPGRWGSSDPRLGIPIKWAQIAGARVIIETGFVDRKVEPSQGAHFFHNVTSFRLGYLTAAHLEQESIVGGLGCDLSWLATLPAAFSTANVRHIHLDAPLRVFLDGQRGLATILKP